MPYVPQLSCMVEISNGWSREKFLHPRLKFSSSIILVVLSVVYLSSPLYFLYLTILPCLCNVVCVLENLLSHM